MKSAWLVALMMAVIPISALSEDVPTKMTHMIVQMSGTDIPAGSFAELPKTMWRASSIYCRIDEEPDPSQGLHLRTVIHEPDAWLVNLASNQAKHMVDTGPTLNCRMPIFAFGKEMAMSKIGELEYGHELEFFKRNGAKQVQGPDLKSFKANYYELTINGAVLKLVERADIHAPIMVGLIRGDNVVTVRYLLWDDQVPFKADVFAKPTGVIFEEEK